MINLGTPGAPRPTFLSACACETGCRGPAACSWHPCSRCLWVGREQGSGQTQEGVTNRPSLPWTEGFPGTRTLRAKPGRTPGKPGQLVKQALRPRTHRRALPMPPPQHALGRPETQHLLRPWLSGRSIPRDLGPPSPLPRTVLHQGGWEPWARCPLIGKLGKLQARGCTHTLPRPEAACPREPCTHLRG